MNYKKIYDNLIIKAQNRTLGEGVYREVHHIVPRCMGGSDCPSNLVSLTAEEHYVAHQLLSKIYPTHPGLISAVIYMTIGPKSRFNNKLYGWIRKRHSILSSIKMKKWLEENEHPRGFLNKQHTEEAKKNQSKKVLEYYIENELTTNVFQYDMKGTFIKKFDSLMDAARSIDGNPSNIKYCAEGKFQYMYGFRWSYDENTIFEQIKERQYVGNRGKMWITNGIESKTIDKESEIPEGWKRGRTLSKT